MIQASGGWSGAGARVLLTGATGFLGKVVLHELLRRRDELGVQHVYVLIRGRKGVAAADRFRKEILGSPCFSRLPEGWPAWVSPVEGELTTEACGLAPEDREALVGELTHVVHCAASVEFNLPIAEATEANVTSALRVLELARDCGRLRSMVDVSTAYVRPHPGNRMPVEERLAPLRWPPEALYSALRNGRYAHPDDQAGLLAETGHPNTYTFTKCLAEHLLTRRRGQVPLVLVRPSIIAASFRHPFPGWIDSAAAFALFAVAIGSGRMRAVMARPKSRLDLVPVDVVAERVVNAAFDGTAQRGTGTAEPPIRHAVAGHDRSPSLRLCAERVGPYFERTPLPDGPAPRLHYLGPDGLRYRFWHRVAHERRAESAPIARRIAETNRLFAYFTHNTFRFRSSVPLEDPEFDPGDYLEIVCRGVYRHLLGGDETAVTVAGRRHRRGQSTLGWVLRRSGANPFLRSAAFAVDRTLSRCLDRVTVDVASFREALAEAPAGAVPVLVPSHRSYLDFVLCSYVCFSRPDLGVAIPHVAAAVEFARIPLLGWLFRRMHAFYLERGRGREDKRLTQAVHGLVRNGHALEFFPEGRRSRSRQFLPPRRGLLRSLQSTGHTCVMLPIAISYDHVPEEETFVRELQGGEKPPMRLLDLLSWTRRMLRGDVELGRAHLACGRPRVLDLGSDVHEVAREIIGELQARTVATTHHLRAFLEASTPADVDVDWLVAAVHERGGRVLDVPRREHPVHPVTERCMRYQFLHLFYPEASLAFAGNPAVEHHIRRNAWAPAASARDPETALGEPRTRALLAALFEPVARGYAATARSLGVPAPGEPVPGPEAVVASLEDVALPDVEGAFDDLGERGVLLRDESAGRWLWGPRADDVVPYAEACERISLGGEES